VSSAIGAVGSLNAVLWRIRDRDGAQPGILTRLDKDTSGLVVVALTPAIHATMQKDGASGRITKEYLAVVRGVPEPREGCILLPLARDAADRRRVVVTEGGAACETRYEVLSSQDGRSLVRCELRTGRTHQIRVHLSASGWPVVGDRVYGEPDASMARQALHAWRVALPHPVTRQRLEFEAPLPDDVARVIG
jgi:23S rRNA pseudouridine1911/1915/1917 synthase